MYSPALVSNIVFTILHRFSGLLFPHNSFQLRPIPYVSAASEDRIDLFLRFDATCIVNLYVRITDVKISDHCHSYHLTYPYAFGILSYSTRTSTVQPSAFAMSHAISMLGETRFFSYLQTMLSDTPISAASSFCVFPLRLRSAEIFSPILILFSLLIDIICVSVVYST